MNRRPGPRLSRRSVLGLGAGAVLGGALAGCGGPGGGSSGFGTNTSLTLPAHVDPPEVPGLIVSELDGVPMGLTSMPDPLPQATAGPPGSGAPFTTFQINWGSPPRPREQNEYWQQLEERLNVRYEPDLVPADAYDTRLATMLSTGEVPDMTFLFPGSANAQQAIKDGAFAELSAVLGGDKILDYPNLAHVPTYQWEVSAVDNGLYGVPCDLAYVNALHVYRRDWAREIGFDAQPADAAEFRQLVVEMSRLGRGRYAFGGYSGGVRAYVEAMFGVPNTWREEGGRLTHSIETDEFEAAMTYTRELWEAGAFHPDALALAEQGAQDRGLFDAGETGWQVASADNWYLSGALDSLRAKNEGAEPELLLPVGHDGGDYTFPASAGYFAVVAISAAAAEDADRLAEILRVMDYLRAPIPSQEGFFLRYGTEGTHFTYGENGVPAPVDSPAPADRDAMFYTGLVPGLLWYSEPDLVTGTIDYTEEVTRHSVRNPTDGLYADSSAGSAGKLEELYEDYVYGLASGRRPMADLREFRTDWAAQGGQTLREEFQAAIQEQ